MNLPGQIESLLQRMDSQSEQSMLNDNSSEHEQSDDPITVLLNKSKETTNPEEPTTNEDLLNALNSLQPQTEYGDPINDDVAKSVTALYQTEGNKANKEKFMEKFKIPTNCKILEVPRVNQEIWSRLPSDIRQKDFATQQQQQLISLAGTMMTKITEKVFTTKESINGTLRQDLIRDCMSVSSVLAASMEEMNKNRRNEMKPAIAREYVGICSTSKTSAGLLFGENLSEQMRATRSTAQLVVHNQASRGAFRGNQRFQPYQRRLNFQGPSFRPRGANRFQRSRPQRPFNRSYRHPRQ